MPNQPQILTVSQLNSQVRAYLEQSIGSIHVEGEISNLTKPASGHFYFTLKDANAQIRCVYFRNRHTPISINLQNGQLIVAKGVLSIYEARGDYQLIVSEFNAAGIGDLYRQFELLKKKLASQGLFDVARKKSWPRFPNCIAVITSSTAAALRDILTTLKRRYKMAHVLVYPSEVQGTKAPQQLVQALQRAHSDGRADVIILARGGGSIEDLWPFNDEKLALAIAQSTLPIVTGIGHETDFTIADFVADYRAATPTAAAETVTPDSIELLENIATLQAHLHRTIKNYLQRRNERLRHVKERLRSPSQQISAYWQRLDYCNKQLQQAMQQIIIHKRHKLTSHLTTLHAVSPLATLDRGYAIATHKGHVLFDCQQVIIGDKVDIKLAHGKLSCEVICLNN